MSGDEEVQALVRVDGRVQGVYYRASAAEQAQSLGLHGYVRNTSDGRVEVRARGTRSRVESLIAWCRKGPPAAKVTDVEVTWEAPDQRLNSFVVVR